MKTRPAIKLRLLCDQLAMTGEVDEKELKRLISPEQSAALLAIDSGKLQVALKGLYLQLGDASLLAGEGHVLLRIISRNLTGKLRAWIESDYRSPSGEITQIVSSRQCPICCGKITNGRRKLFCESCFANLTERETAPWFKFRHILELKNTGEKRLIEEMVGKAGLGEIPVRFVSGHITPLASKHSLIKYTSATARFARLNSYLQSTDQLKKLIGIVLKTTSVEELSDAELERWVLTIPRVAPVLGARGIVEAQSLISTLSGVPHLTTLELGKKFWPDPEALTRGLFASLQEPLTLTFLNRESHDLFQAWGSPRLYEFRRILNLELYSELEACQDFRLEFKEELRDRGLTLVELKNRIRVYGRPISVYLKHYPTLNNELFLAWMAYTKCPSHKLDLLFSPPTEITSLKSEMAKRSELGRELSKPTVKVPGLYYYQPPGSDKPAEGYIQRSWGKRFWS